MSLLYALRSGKNSKVSYYALNYFRQILPRCFYRWNLKAALAQVKEEEKDYILDRVNYYGRLPASGNGYLNEHPEQKSEFISLKDQKMCRQKVYFFDTYEYYRWFSYDLYWKMCPGDVTFVPKVPAIVKSRPISGDNNNSVLMKLNKVRHFIYVNDNKSFSEKKDVALFRGKVGQPGTPQLKPNRYRFMEMYSDAPYCDLGEVGKHANQKWLVPKMTINEQLDYKFILCLEGNDVASNLKWVMSSNSLAVMPRPKFETWFMEGRLIPNVHYVEIKDDFSDLKERMDYYISHPDEAQKIIDNANAYVAQFRNIRTETLISLMVMNKYLSYVNG
jgi:hypothetical protein